MKLTKIDEEDAWLPTTEAIAADGSQPLAKLLERRLNKECCELHSGCGQSSSDNVARLVWIVEKKLIAVEIIDHQEPVAPRTLLERNALGLEFGAQCVHRGACGLRCRGLDVQRNENQPVADLLWPRFSQDKRAALSIHLCDIRSAVLVFVPPGTREAEPLNVKAERGLNVGHVQDGAREPVCHRRYPLDVRKLPV